MEKPKRGRLIQAPVTEDAYWRIKQAAAKQSLSLGAFIRQAIESAMAKHRKIDGNRQGKS